MPTYIMLTHSIWGSASCRNSTQFTILTGSSREMDRQLQSAPGFFGGAFGGGTIQPRVTMIDDMALGRHGY